MAHWYPWLPKAAIALALLLFALAGVGPSREGAGFGRPRWDEASPYVVVAMVVCVAVAFADPSIPGDPHRLECVAFEPSMPGLDEELFFRGTLLALLNKSWPRAWSLFGAKVGWGAVITAAIFLFGHLLSDEALRIHLAIAPWGAASLLGFGICCTWIRERSGNVWWAVLAHDVANSALVVFAWFR